MFVKVLIVLACVAVALGGVRKLSAGPQVFKTGGKIIGGTEAAAGEIPWQVSLQLNTGQHFNGGAIISDKWIVTSAGSSGQRIEELRVVAGTLEKDKPGSIHLVSKVVTHENYTTLTMENDIALWQISDTFTWDANTAPVNLLPQGTPTPVGTEALISGWGSTIFNGAYSDVLLKAVVPIYDTAVCNDVYSDIFPINNPGKICAGFAEGGVAFCAGDVGGPLFVDGNLHGISSWSYNCALPGFPGVHTEVSAFRDWITANSGV